MTTIYYIRHAQPERSADSPYTDRTYPLTDKGINDRILVTEYLRDKNIDVVLSSPFKRAVDTVAVFAEEAGLDVELIEDFRERAITDKWIGIDEFKAFARRQWDDWDYKLPSGECIREVQDRNMAALHDVLRRYEGKNIVIGGHGMALSSILIKYDKLFEYDQHVGMPMPFVAKMVFDGDVCYEVSKIDLFNPSKLPDWPNSLVTTHELGELKAYRYTVIFARYEGKWLYCRHIQRDTFETAGGGIEPGETPLEGAKRELMEETGAIHFTIRPMFDYNVTTNTGFAHGQVFLAEIQELGKLEYEMSEVRKFDTIPKQMRFPMILPVLFERMKNLLY